MILDPYGWEDWQCGPYFCAACGDGDEIAVTASFSDTMHQFKYPLGSTLEGVKKSVAEHFLPKFRQWAQQAESQL